MLLMHFLIRSVELEDTIEMLWKLTFKMPHHFLLACKQIRFLYFFKSQTIQKLVIYPVTFSNSILKSVSRDFKKIFFALNERQ